MHELLLMMYDYDLYKSMQQGEALVFLVNYINNAESRFVRGVVGIWGLGMGMGTYKL
jgi:hypothetical protein